MTKKATGRTEATPLHLYLHRRVREMEGMTNIRVAQALGYEKPNVVAMMWSGSMKVPITKVPELARILELDQVALLRRAMLEYVPEVWQTIERVLGDFALTASEGAIVRAVREQLGGDDVALPEDAKFESELKLLVAEALDRHTRQLLANRPGTQSSQRDGRLTRHNAEMEALLDRQAAERMVLRNQLRRAAS